MSPNEISRRHFLAGTSTALLLSGASSHAATVRKAPYKVLYSNDTTHLEYCISPYRKQGEKFRPEFLEASVEETAGIGVDAHLLQPGTGWVPWWKSKVYPAAEHYRWWQEQYGLPLSGMPEYLVKGGDMVALFSESCRKNGLAPFVSFRMNDTHGLEFAGAPREKVRAFYENTPELWWMTQQWSRDYADHPEYRIDSRSHRKVDWLWDWRLPEVRAYKLGLIRELCSQYDLEGIELDLNRDPFFFNLSKTTSEERRKIMTEVFAETRRMLDASTLGTKRKWLCLRIPNVSESYDRMGLDLGAAVEAGVDMLNVSASYYTCQTFDIEAIRKQVPRRTAIFLEMTQCTSFGRFVNDTGYDSAVMRLTTDKQFRSTAELGYDQGADGVSVFNFVYYRSHEGSNANLGGAAQEPPFHIFKELRDPAKLTQKSRQYFLGNLLTFNSFFPDVGAPYRQIPQTLQPGQDAHFTLRLARSTRAKKVLLQILIDRQEPHSKWRAEMNGVALGPGHYVDAESEVEEMIRAWDVPSECLRRGENAVRIGVEESSATTIHYLTLDVSS